MPLALILAWLLVFWSNNGKKFQSPELSVPDILTERHCVDLAERLKSLEQPDGTGKRLYPDTEYTCTNYFSSAIR